MIRKNLFLVPDIKEFIDNNQLQALKEFCEESHPADIAEILEALEPEDAWKILKVLEHDSQAEIFANLIEEVQVEIATSLSKKELVTLITNMSHDDRVDLLRKIPEEKIEIVLPALAQAEREDIRRLMSYEEGTAGSIMTSEYVILAKDLKVREAIEELRKQAPDKETIYYTYIVDKDRRLIGFVSLADLITEPSTKTVAEIMDDDIIYVHANDDQEEVSHKISKYDLLAIPVVNENNQLVGIVTYDDAIDVLNQEHTEDMEKFMAISGSHEMGNYLKTPVWIHFKNRVYWVIGLAIIGLFSGTVISSYESTIASLIVLTLFMPMLADTGGNVGSQSASVVIRALALQDLTPKDLPKILFKEFRISLMLSFLLGCLTFVNAMIIMRNATIPENFSFLLIAVTIALALSLQVISSTLIGALLPLLAAKMKFDPAVAASPAITTLVDITGLLIYFSLAKIILGL